MSKWVPTWSYVAMDYGTVVATYEDVSQRCLLRNNLNGTALRLRFNNLYSEAPLTIATPRRRPSTGSPASGASAGK